MNHDQLRTVLHGQGEAFFERSRERRRSGRQRTWCSRCCHGKRRFRHLCRIADRDSDRSVQGGVSDEDGAAGGAHSPIPAPFPSSRFPNRSRPPDTTHRITSPERGSGWSIPLTRRPPRTGSISTSSSSRGTRASAAPTRAWPSVGPAPAHRVGRGGSCLFMRQA